MHRIDKYFDWSFRALLIFLPFYTVLSVFFSQKLGVPGVSFIKEILMLGMIACIVIADISGYKKIVWSRYDLFIFFYIAIALVVTSFTTGLTGMIYGGRYDFSFLVAFFALYHGRSFLREPIAYYLRLFLISGGIMLIISILLKWPFSEDLLRYVGYSGNPSHWQFGGPPTIFHGVDGANVRRFQGLLDGPNTMGAYLILYMGILAYYFRNYKAWYFLIGCVLLFLSIFLFYTYSRSAILGLILGVGIIILFLLPKIYRKYRVQLITTSLIVIATIGGVFLQYAGNIGTLVMRGGSTNGHMERMQAGIVRFLEKPFGQGLGSSGPAYRYVENLSGKSREEIEALDKNYIPESWYIQQLVESGFLGLISFLLIMGSLLFGLFRRYIVIFGAFLAILVMNFFLHTFESAHIALSLFVILGLILAPVNRNHESK